MKKVAQLYDAFGELLYVVAMADGIIQKEELDALDRVLKNHPWAKEIKWSFEYEVKHHEALDYLYKKVIDICHEFGPNPEYKFLVEILHEVANAHPAGKEVEDAVVNQFTKELTDQFQKDLDKIGE